MVWSTLFSNRTATVAWSASIVRFLKGSQDCSKLLECLLHAHRRKNLRAKNLNVNLWGMMQNGFIINLP